MYVSKVAISPQAQYVVNGPTVDDPNDSLYQNLHLLDVDEHLHVSLSIHLHLVHALYTLLILDYPAKLKHDSSILDKNRLIWKIK